MLARNESVQAAGLREPATAITAARRRAMLAMLCVIYTLNHLDRQIVVILQEPIKAEFHLQDWQLGLLTGGAFGLFYTLMGIPLAHWIDRGINRTRLIAGMLAVWSAMTALCGVARGYGQFFLARMGVGLAEAGFAPASQALISDLYPREERPRAMGLFSIGVPIGIMAGMSIGGIVAHHTDWRVALLVAGLPGLILALLFRAFAREPLRGATELQGGLHDRAAPPVSLWRAMRLLGRRMAFIHVIAGTAVTALVEMAMTSWMPSFLIRAHGLSLSQVGVALGVIAGIGGIVGTVAGGWQGSYFGRKGMHHMLWVPIAGLLLCVPFYLAVLYAPSGYGALGLMILPTILGAFWTAPAIALTQNLAPVPMRARAAALRIVAANLVGMALGPLLTGALSDWFTADTGSSAEGLRDALAVMTLLFVWAALHWVLAARALARELREGTLD